MINKLKRKFIIVTSLVLFTVFFVVVATMNVVNYCNINDRADNIIDVIANNDGKMPGHIKPNEHNNDELPGETPFSARFFTVSFSEDEIVNVNLDRIAIIDEEEAKNVSSKLYSENKKSGFYNNFKYRYVETISGEMYVFFDCARELDSFKEFLWASIWISVGGLSVILILVLIFSSIVTRPIAESYSKQKEFITNINHEIKTPLSIIKASNEIIEMQSGDKEWTDIINNQINRLTDLTDNLVFLSRMDEENHKIVKSEFNLSEIAFEVCEPFVALAKSKGKKLEVNIEEGLMYFGEISLIGQLISILLDNAIKYSINESVISIKVMAHLKNKRIIVRNEVESIEEGKLDYYFERFYKGKKDNKGHGIGLSVAKAIVQAHNGKIQAISEEGKVITFIATI